VLKSSLTHTGDSAEFKFRAAVDLKTPGNRSLFSESYSFTERSTFNPPSTPNCILSILSKFSAQVSSDIASNNRVVRNLQNMANDNFSQLIKKKGQIAFTNGITSSSVVNVKKALATKEFSFDTDTNVDVIVIVIVMTGAELKHRDWIIKQIEKIISSKNVMLVAGENPPAGHFKVLDESIKNGEFSIKFKAAY